MVVPWRAGTASDRNEASDLSGQPFFELKTNTPIIPSRVGDILRMDRDGIGSGRRGSCMGQIRVTPQIRSANSRTSRQMP